MSENVVQAEQPEVENVNDRDFVEKQNSPEIEPEQKEAPSLPEVAESQTEKSIHDLPLPGDDVEEKKERLPKWAEKRLSKKDREIAQRAAEAEAYKAELERLKSSAAMNQSQYSQPDHNAPRREDFENDDDYIDARIDYKQRKDFARRAEENQQAAMLEAQQEFNKKLQSAFDSGSEKYDDFEEKVEMLFSPGFPPNRLMAEAIVDSKYKDDILYFLATYVDEAKKIAKLNPAQAVKEIARLEDRFEAKRKSNVSKAPAPVTPLRANQGKATEGDPNKMGQEDFVQWYKSKFGTR